MTLALAFIVVCFLAALFAVGGLLIDIVLDARGELIDFEDGES